MLAALNLVFQTQRRSLMGCVLRIVGDAQNAILSGATTARDQISAVNLDDEAVQLLRFQQAYQASSRVISVAKDMFQSLMEIR